MTKLDGDVANRVRRLPKPSTASDALQPVFEAVSNAIHAIGDQFNESAHKSAHKDGHVDVTFKNTKSPISYEVIISDNGVGLEPDRFRAFCTTDTDYKINRGGKGVGRLLWLDAFSKIHVVSRYRTKGVIRRRSFDFSLLGEEPIYNETDEVDHKSGETGTNITMTGLRSNSYSALMPVQAAVVRKHFASHFLADFLLGQSPRLNLTFEDSHFEFPQVVMQLLVEQRANVSVDSTKYGVLSVDNYVFKKEASSDFEGSHQVHLVSSGRTVHTRKIDGLIGIRKIGPDADSVFHACISGKFLDERVNQERTQFNFSEEVAAELTKECVTEIKKKVLSSEVSQYEEFRLERLQEFVSHYPSFGFESAGTLLAKTPVNADNHEAFAASLIKHKIRADKERQSMVQSALEKLFSSEEVAPDLGEEIRKAAQAITADENRQLMEYVMRRKFVVEILDALLGKVRQMKGHFDTHLEDTFHELICPMRVVGGDPYRIVPVSHDLWLIDERLAPATYFASDAQIKDFIEEGGDDRVDLMIWDKVHGLGLGPEDKLERVILVEFKKPERSSYKADYVLGRQMNRYMRQLKDRKIRSHTGDLVDLSKDVVFHCYIVADLTGDLEVDTQDWGPSPSGRGRLKYLQGEFKGTMEVIEWKELVRDAKVRNQNFLEAANLSFNRKGQGSFSSSQLNGAFNPQR